MNTAAPNPSSAGGRGRVAIVGAGPAGISTALALRGSGFTVHLYEQHAEIRASGNVINLWSAPQKILQVYGIDTNGLGAPAQTELRRYDGRFRARFNQPSEVAKKFNGGFVGLLRWDLYQRLGAAVPPEMLRYNKRVVSVNDRGDDVLVRTADGTEAEYDLVVGTDGIESVVRRTLWGDAPKREHRLRAYLGYVFDDSAKNTGVFAHDRRVQGSYTPIVYEGRRGYGWWVIEPEDPKHPFVGDGLARAASLTRRFADPLPSLIRRTEPGHVHQWPIRDRPPLKQWSRGRLTLAGDAAHPTSPYAAYGAGMSVEDGYFLGRALRGLDLTDGGAVRAALDSYERRRRPHTTEVQQQAYFAGQMFHHVPPVLRAVRDLIFDHTPLLQKQQGDAQPLRSARQLAEIEEPPAVVRS